MSNSRPGGYYGNDVCTPTALLLICYGSVLLLRSSANMQQWASPFTAGVSWLSRPDQLHDSLTEYRQRVLETDFSRQSVPIEECAWKERIFVDISSCSSAMISVTDGGE